MQQGLLYCGSNLSWSSAFCISKLIQTIFSALLLIFIVYQIIAQIRQIGSFSFQFVQLVQTLMIFTLIYNIAFSLFHSIYYLFYLESLFYDLYFCTLVFYVTYKIFSKNPKQNHKYLLVLKIGFAILVLAFVGIFIYSVIVDIKTCQQIWFLVVDLVGLCLCLIMIVLGKNHQKKQLQKILDFSNSQKIKNPLSRMWVIIIVNLICQLMQFIQSLIFLTRSDIKCQFSSDPVINTVIKVLFSILSLHVSFLATIIIFRMRRKGQLEYMRRNPSNLNIDLVEPNYLQMSSFRKTQIKSSVVNS